MNCCPTCGRTFPKPKSTKAELPTDSAAMTDAEAFAYYRRTAPVEDLKFFLRWAEMSPELRIDAEALLDGPTLPRTEHYRRLCNLHDRWRRERNEAERAAGVPAIGAAIPEQTEVA